MQMSSTPLKQRCPWPSLGSDVGSPDPSPQSQLKSRIQYEGVSSHHYSMVVCRQEQKEIRCKTWLITSVCLHQSPVAHCHGMIQVGTESHGPGGCHPHTGSRPESKGLPSNRAQYVSACWMRKDEVGDARLCSSITLKVPRTEEL